jgi:hypothetical protein
MKIFYFYLFAENSNSTQCENDPKKFKTNSNTYQSIIFHIRANDFEENSKIKYRKVYYLFISFVSFIETYQERK